MSEYSQRSKTENSSTSVSSAVNHKEGKDCNESSELLSVQPKLAIGSTDDPLEHEADTMADRIMRMPEQNFIQRKCAHCEQEEKEIHRKSLSSFLQKKDLNNGIVASDPVTNQIQSNRGNGSAIDGDTRSFMENSFGADLSDVKIHTDNEAIQMNRELNAKAFTVGKDIYFNKGEYQPGSNEGKHLLAHELTHTIQQGGTRDMVQRKIHESPVVKDIQPGAQVCFVHLHGDEQNAFHTAKDLHGRFCSNFVHLTYASTPTREIHVDSGSGATTTTCLADPNRIFNDKGISASLTKLNKKTCVTKASRTAATKEIKSFRDNELLPAINACRGSDTGKLLPIVAFHNNTEGDLSIKSYQPGGGEAGATEKDKSKLGKRINPHIQSGEDPDNFLLVTQTADFDSLSTSHNVVLQSTKPTDDGSLSVVMAKERYINIESQEDTFKSTTDPFFIANLKSGEDVMNKLGVGPCRVVSGATTAPAIQPTLQDDATKDPNVLEPVDKPFDWKELLEKMWRWIQEKIIWLLEKLIWLYEKIKAFLKKIFSLRDPIPDELAKRCKTFNSVAELDIRKVFWQGEISKMKPDKVVRWIVGLDAPPSAVNTETIAQKNCLLDAIQVAATSSTKLQLPAVPKGKDPHDFWIESPHRSFTHQKGIWDRKFLFTGDPFDRITSDAIAICKAAGLGTGLVAGGKWDPSDKTKTHQSCWAILPDDQKQKEILQASSAPGISRHHMGSDFDLFSLEPTEWATAGAGKNFAEEYVWLQNNAASYGFIQSFTGSSVPAGGFGYMEERWHWSYYPVSQALLEFASANQAAIQTELFNQWRADPKYSFIKSHWKDFVFNVSNAAKF